MVNCGGVVNGRDVANGGGVVTSGMGVAVRVVTRKKSGSDVALVGLTVDERFTSVITTVVSMGLGRVIESSKNGGIGVSSGMGVVVTRKSGSDVALIGLTADEGFTSVITTVVSMGLGSVIESSVIGVSSGVGVGVGERSRVCVGDKGGVVKAMVASSGKDVSGNSVSMTTVDSSGISRKGGVVVTEGRERDRVPAGVMATDGVSVSNDVMLVAIGGTMLSEREKGSKSADVIMGIRASTTSGVVMGSSITDNERGVATGEEGRGIEAGRGVAGGEDGRGIAKEEERRGVTDKGDSTKEEDTGWSCVSTLLLLGNKKSLVANSVAVGVANTKGSVCEVLKKLSVIDGVTGDCICNVLTKKNSSVSDGVTVVVSSSNG